MTGTQAATNYVMRTGAIADMRWWTMTVDEIESEFDRINRLWPAPTEGTEE